LRPHGENTIWCGTISFFGDHTVFVRRRKFLPLLVALLLLLPPSASSAEEGPDAAWQETVNAWSQLPCLSPDEFEFGRQVLRGLSYPSMRIVRGFSPLPGMNFAQAQDFFSLLIRHQYSFEQALTFETWCGLPGANAVLARQALELVARLDYQRCRTMAALAGVEGITARLTLETMPLILRLDEANLRAAQPALALPGLRPESALDTLGLIALLRDNQAWAAETLAQLPGLDSRRYLTALPIMRQLRQDDAWNYKKLCELPKLSPDESWFWLLGYFANPLPVQQDSYHKLSEERRRTLLAAYHAAGYQIIWKINDLHAVTDRFGQEYSQHQLSRMGAKGVVGLFDRLSPRTKSRFGSEFQQGGGSIPVLRRATAADRVQVSQDLTTANMYALLSQGSELYDSSFRDILVPIFHERLKNEYRGDLLALLRHVDPANARVSDFIVSLAQKGKLTALLPQDPSRQRQVLELVLGSAFENEQSLLLFSATFMPLLEALQPEIRSLLIARMSDLGRAPSSVFARQILLILQFYLHEYPELLSSGDQQRIGALLREQGSIDLSRYLVTPFASWKADGRLSSLSIFHPDDDGGSSFVSNANTLMAGGYRPRLSRAYTDDDTGTAARRQAEELVSAVARQPGGNLGRLFNAMLNNHFQIDFVKELGGLTISHTVAVYHDEEEQRRLLLEFLEGGHEMFAQRGHSYWRGEQLIDPIEQLIKQGRANGDSFRKQRRFLSLGSCGGIKVYTKLHQLFQGQADILATIGTGLANINDPYNRTFFEVIATSSGDSSWKHVAAKSAAIFGKGYGRDYLQPGSLPAILHKLLDEERPATQ